MAASSQCALSVVCFSDSRVLFIDTAAFLFTGSDKDGVGRSASSFIFSCCVPLFFFYSSCCIAFISDKYFRLNLLESLQLMIVKKVGGGKIRHLQNDGKAKAVLEKIFQYCVYFFIGRKKQYR